MMMRRKASRSRDAAAYVRGKTAGEYGQRSRGSHPEYKKGYRFGKQEFLAWQKAQAAKAKRKGPAKRKMRRR